MIPQSDALGAWLERHRDEILEAWRALVFARLAPPAGRFLSTQDPFGNPLGHRVHVSTAAVLDALAAGQPPEALAAAMEPWMRVLAIQGGPASQAVGFVPMLERAAGQVRERMRSEEAASLRQRLDALLLVAFDVYMLCREEIHEIRVREARRRVSALLERLAGAGQQAGAEGTATGASPSRP